MVVYGWIDRLCGEEEIFPLPPSPSFVLHEDLSDHCTSAVGFLLA